MLAKMFVPETESPVTAGVVKVEVERTDPNVLGRRRAAHTDGCTWRSMSPPCSFRFWR
jgi:hypothetical protein